MWNWMKRLIRSGEPHLSMTPHPVDVNPTPSAREQRNQARMARLKQAIAAGDPRPELKEELARREKGGR